VKRSISGVVEEKYKQVFAMSSNTLRVKIYHVFPFCIGFIKSLSNRAFKTLTARTRTSLIRNKDHFCFDVEENLSIGPFTSGKKEHAQKQGKSISTGLKRYNILSFLIILSPR